MGKSKFRLVHVKNIQKKRKIQKQLVVSIPLRLLFSAHLSTSKVTQITAEDVHSEQLPVAEVQSVVFPNELEVHCEQLLPAVKEVQPVSNEELLPRNWIKFGHGQYCKIKSLGTHLTLAVSLVFDSKWLVYVNGRMVPETCAVFDSLQFSNERGVIDFMKAIDNAYICIGNPEEDFVAVCKEKDGVLRGAKGLGDVVAEVVFTPFVDSREDVHNYTVRRTDCDVLCIVTPSGHSRRCSQCKVLRSTLRSKVSRQAKQSSTRTSVSSHTRYIDLNSTEKIDRLGNLHTTLKTTNQTVKRMQKKVKKLIATSAIRLRSEDTDDMECVIAETSPIVKSTFPESSPQRIFWDQQLKFNELKDKRQMRWHPLMIRFALNLRYLSGSAYQAVKQFGINLPSERTLYDYTHWTKPHTGVQYEFVEQFVSQIQEDVTCGHYHCALSMDEMKIKSGLVYRASTGVLAGFVDLGTVNQDIDQMLSVEAGNKKDELDNFMAKQVFVFLARAVFKPSLTMPIAHYFSDSLKGVKIFPLAWEVIETIELYEIPVVSLTSDGAKANRSFYSLHCQGRSKSLPYRTFNPFRQEFNLYFMCDTPHLLKTARNCFSNSFSHSKKRTMQKQGQWISWKHIESLYLSENDTTTPGVRLCHKLTKDHIWLTSYTRMRVNLAAQVMSESVACALEYLDNDDTIESRLFIRMIDKFFDCLNVKGPLIAKLKRKDDNIPYTSAMDRRFEWLSKNFLGYLEEWEKEIASMHILKARERQKLCLSQETLVGLKITVTSFVELAPQLLELPGVKYLLSEVFSQDPLERYFARQRHRGGSNENPTAHQVPHNAVTLVQQQSVYRDVKTMNVMTSEEALLHNVMQPLQKRRRTI